MATAGLEKYSLSDYDECPVCRECLKDPRTLDCGHYFCRGCLEGMLREDPKGSIKCPSCREVTKILEGSVVNDLPKHEGKYTIQCQISDFLARAKGQESSRHCDICRDKKVSATVHCYQCRLNLCKDCLKRHEQKALPHKTVPIVDSLFCSTHTKDIVTMYCEDCKINTCAFCVFDEHDRHQIVDIEDVAKHSRQRLQELVKTMSTIERDEKTLKNIQCHLDTARELEGELKDCVTKARKLLQELETEIDQVERDTKAKLSGEIKTLAMYESDIKDILSSRESLIDQATYLADTASDPELIDQEKNFPTTIVSSFQNIEKTSVELPVFSTTFMCMCTQLEQMVLDCKDRRSRKLTLEFSSRNTFEDLSKQHTVPVGYTICGITMDFTKKRLVVRTADVNGPLKIYNYQGQLQESLGASVHGLADGNFRGLCMDTKRDCYLAACHNTLALVNRAGQQIKSINVGNTNRDVAYHKEDDLYLVCDSGTSIVYLINPNTSQVTRQIGSLGSRPTQFNAPYYIHVGTVTGIGSQCIIVSDLNNHCLKVFDTMLRHVKTIGSVGSGDRQLKNPEGVSTDSNGRVILCDHSNNRVVCYWTDSDDHEQWSCLLSSDWGGNKPYHLALDNELMVMVIVDSTFKSVYIYD